MSRNRKARGRPGAYERPPGIQPGSAVRVTFPDGRQLDTRTCSEVFGAPPIVGVYGVDQCVLMAWVAPLPDDAPPLQFIERFGTQGRSTHVVPRWRNP